MVQVETGGFFLNEENSINVFLIKVVDHLLSQAHISFSSPMKSNQSTSCSRGQWLNLKSLFNHTQFITRATRSGPAPSTLPQALVRFGRKNLLCQYISEQFQEMTRAKHLRKDLRLNPSFPRGQQVNKGKSSQRYVELSTTRLRRHDVEDSSSARRLCQG